MKNSNRSLDNQTWQTNSWLQQKLPKFDFRTHTTTLWLMELSSILSAKFDCPVAHQNFSLLHTYMYTKHECGFNSLIECKGNGGNGIAKVKKNYIWVYFGFYGMVEIFDEKNHFTSQLRILWRGTDHQAPCMPHLHYSVWWCCGTTWNCLWSGKHYTETLNHLEWRSLGFL